MKGMQTGRHAMSDAGHEPCRAKAQPRLTKTGAHFVVDHILLLGGHDFSA